MIYFAYPDPSDLLGCYSPTKAQHRAVIADEKIQLGQEAFFGNSIFPRYAFTVGDPADDGDGDNDGPPTLEGHQRKALETL